MKNLAAVKTVNSVMDTDIRKRFSPLGSEFMRFTRDISALDTIPPVVTGWRIV